jgi:hypothetical protein
MSRRRKTERPEQSEQSEQLDTGMPLQVHINQAAKMLSYSTRTIRRLIEHGELQTVGHYKRRRVVTSSIYEYQKRNLS